jgi:DNA-binding NtrC family response regulator
LLVVDDDESVRRLVVKVLEMGEYTCDEADGVRSAQEKLLQRDYAVLVTDKNVPLDATGVEGGMELLGWVRKHLPELAVVVMTGYPTVESVVEALRLGAFDYLVKPLNPGVLKQKVDRAWEYHRFVNPEAVLSLYLNLTQDILQTTSGNVPDLDAWLNLVQERLDRIFLVFRSAEHTLLDQRQRLAAIASYAQSLQDMLAPDDPARELLKNIAKEAAPTV